MGAAYRCSGSVNSRYARTSAPCPNGWSRCASPPVPWAQACPEADLLVTADHALVMDGVLINAGALVGQPGIATVPLYDLPSPFIVYHVETEAHEVLLANGTPAESFIDYASRHRFDNYADYLARFRRRPADPGNGSAAPFLAPDAGTGPHCRSRC